MAKDKEKSSKKRGSEEMDVDEPTLGAVKEDTSEPKKKKEKKSKKSKENEDGDEKIDLESLCMSIYTFLRRERFNQTLFTGPIAKPFADKKMSKRLLRTVKKGEFFLPTL
jgi:hypothetical protein